MADASIEDNPGKSKVEDDALPDGGLLNQKAELPAADSPDQLLNISTNEGGVPDASAGISNAGAAPGVDAEISKAGPGAEHGGLPNDIKVGMETPSKSDPSGLAGAMPDTLKASSLNRSLGNEVLDMDTIRNIKVNVQAVLGGISMSVSKLSNLKEGELVSLEKAIGEEIEILANGQLIAHGEIVVIEGDIPKFGITITSVVGS